MKSPLFRYAVTMADRSDIGGRVRALLDTDQARAISRPASLVALTALGFAAGSLATLRFVPHRDPMPEPAFAGATISVASSAPVEVEKVAADVAQNSIATTVAVADDGDERHRLRTALKSLMDRANDLKGKYMAGRHRLKEFKDPRNPEIDLVNAEVRVTLAEYENTLRQIAAIERRLQTPEGIEEIEAPTPAADAPPPPGATAEMAAVRAELRDREVQLQAQQDALRARQEEMQRQRAETVAADLRATERLMQDEIAKLVASGYRSDSKVVRQRQEALEAVRQKLAHR